MIWAQVPYADVCACGGRGGESVRSQPGKKTTRSSVVHPSPTPPFMRLVLALLAVTAGLVTADDPAGSWLAYVKSNGPAGQPVTFVNATWIVPTDPTSPGVLRVWLSWPEALHACHSPLARATGACGACVRVCPCITAASRPVPGWGVWVGVSPRGRGRGRGQELVV